MRRKDTITIISDLEQSRVLCIEGIWVAKSSSIEDVIQAIQESKELSDIESRILTIDAWSNMVHGPKDRIHLVKQLPIGGSMTVGYEKITRLSESLISVEIVNAQ